MYKLKTVFNSDDFLIFLITIFCFGIAYGLFMGVINNFLAEILLITRFERGIVELLRELPGLGLILLVALLYRHSETRIIRLALFISLCGLFGFFITGPNRVVGIICLMIWSTGEHLLMPVRYSIAIHSAYKNKEGRALGITGSFRSIGQVIGYYLVPVVFLLMKNIFPAASESNSIIPFKAVFLIASIFLILGILCSTRFHKSAFHLKRERLYINKKYLRYYILEMFFGARKQVFLTFAPFVLILNYNASTEFVATLYGIYSLLNIFLNPLMGKLLDKVGYKVILIGDAILLIIICILYGFSHHMFSANVAIYVVAAIFILDGMLFIVGMARSMYARSISADQNELTATLSSGISINHIISIIIALLGGLIWEYLGIELLFICAAGFGVGALLYSCFLPKPANLK